MAIQKPHLPNIDSTPNLFTIPLLENEDCSVKHWEIF
jgi:hypothetical protein